MMDYKKINLMIPTFKRSKTSLPIVIDSALKTASDLDNICFSFCVNQSDQETIDFLHKKYWPRNNMWCVVNENTEQPNLAFYWNLLHKETKFKSDDTMVTMVGDDMEFETHGWDAIILETARQTNGECIIHCDDAFVGKDKCCIQLFTTEKMIMAQKKPFMCDVFHADMIDVIWWIVGKLTNTRIYLDNVVIKHNHASAKIKSEWDETMLRLEPIQVATRQKENQVYATRYAYVCAKNIVTNGIGRWDILGG
jgi:hypothetical protein